MLSGMNKEDLAFIARNGGGLDISGRGWTAEDLAFIARNMQAGASFIIRGASLSREEYAFIARNGHATVVFTD